MKMAAIVLQKVCIIRIVILMGASLIFIAGFSSQQFYGPLQYIQ